jgi:integrase
LKKNGSGKQFPTLLANPRKDPRSETGFNHWLQIKEQTRSGKTLERYRQVVRDFITSLGDRADAWIHHTSSQDILAYRTHLIKTGRTARTANLSVIIISAGFRAALKDRKIDTNPCTVIDKLPAEDLIERGIFSPKQVAKLVQAAEGDWKGAILLGYLTGARLSDVANMQWSAIDWQNKTLKFTPRKTRKPLTIPLHPQLERELRKNPGIGKAQMFPSLAGTPTGGTYGLSGQFAAIMEKAGVQGTHVQTRGGRVLSSLSFHCLRHSFASAMANAGVAPEVRMLLTGHSDRDIHASYSHLEMKVLRDAVWRLPSV